MKERKEQEAELWARYYSTTGEAKRAAEDALVRLHKGLAHKAYESRWRTIPRRYRDVARQAAISSLFMAVRGYDPARGFAFSTYATNVAHNAITREVRRENGETLDGLNVKYVLGHASDAVGRVTVEPEPVGAAEIDGPLRHALEALDPRERLILWLCHVEGYSLREVGERLGLSMQRVGAIRKGALRTVREGWGEHAPQMG